VLNEDLFIVKNCMDGSLLVSGHISDFRLPGMVHKNLEARWNQGSSGWQILIISIFFLFLSLLHRSFCFKLIFISFLLQYSFIYWT